MDKTTIGIIICVGFLVYGLFTFANYDQTRTAAAVTENDIRLERQPKVIETGAELGMTLIVKIVASAVVSLLIAGAYMAYQAARIRELKQGGWDRFWARRQPRPSKKRSSPKNPGLSDLINLMVLRELSGDKRDRNR